MRRSFYLFFKWLATPFRGRENAFMIPLRAFYRRLQKILMPARVEIRGLTFFLNPSDRVISEVMAKDLIWEPLKTDMLEKILKPGDVFLDIGANIGYYSILGARCVGEKGKVFAVEPEPLNLSLLAKNIHTNGFDERVSIIPMAASNTKGAARLYLSGENAGDHRMLEHHDIRQFVEVQQIPLDDYFEKFNDSIALSKIDVQGTEWKVLEGMRKLISRNTTMKFIIERSPSLIEKIKRSVEIFEDLFSDKKFIFFAIDEVGRRINRVSMREILNMGEVDFLAIPVKQI